MKNKFWYFRQNNSGGYFINFEVAGVCENIIVEAPNKNEAWSRLCEIGEKSKEGFWESCDCCGERWSDWLEDSDGKDVPCIYDTPVEQKEAEIFNKRAFVHYINGSFKEFIFRQKDNSK